MFGPTILLCGFLTDAVGRKEVWRAGSMAVAASILIFACTRTYGGALVAVVLLGIGWATQVNVSNVLMRVAVPADGPREQFVWATNFFDFVFGFGAFVTPMVLGLILRKLGYSKGLVLLAMLAAVPVVLGAFAEMQPPAMAAQALAAAAPVAPSSGASALLSSPLFWLLGFAFFFFVPLETVRGRVGDHACASTNPVGRSGTTREAIGRADAVGFLARLHGQPSHPLHPGGDGRPDPASGEEQRAGAARGRWASPACC